MSIDITFNIEIKTENGWELYARPNIEKKYNIFEKLAGVRGDIKNAICEPKGLPGDSSYIVRKSYEYTKKDNHTPSWFGLEEIKSLNDWVYCSTCSYSLEHNILHCYLEGNSFANFNKYHEDYPEWIKDVRFVFWFR